MAVVVLLTAGIGYALVRPVPAVNFRPALGTTVHIPGPPVRLAWPAEGQAAAEVQGVGSFGQSGSGRAAPIASLTKMMTALVIVADHPLAPAGPGVSDGPIFSFGPLDVLVWANERAMDDSVLRVAAGENLTERQMLEALLVPSADNIADQLARWDAGTVAEFVRKMNATATRWGLASTHYADASGLDPRSVSTPQDQIKVAEALMADPALAAIVGSSSVTFPVAGVLHSFTPFLGQNGVEGVKTGLTDQAGGCAVLAARRQVGARTFSVFVAVIGQHAFPPDASLSKAGNVADALVVSVESSLKETTVVAPGKVMGQLVSAWGAHTPALASRGIGLVGWPGLAVSVAFHLVPTADSAMARRLLGTVKLTLGAQQGQTPMVTSATVPGPSWLWRVRHP
ncbi:MAG: D-alanyl-D-alanine carboxypeptidase family protein [Acidimicrobiales bacterium]